MHDLTAFQRDILYIVAGNDRCNGLEIKAALEEYYDTEEVHHGRLYPNLDDLVDMGLLQKGQKDRRENWYATTGRAKRALTARREWESETAGTGVIEA